MERNRIYYYKNQKLYQSIIAQLSSQIRNCMMVHQQPDILPGRSGRLDPARVWRSEYVMDDRVFHANYEEKKPLFTVDLLLDASASRLQYQEMIGCAGSDSFRKSSGMSYSGQSFGILQCTRIYSASDSEGI